MKKQLLTALGWIALAALLHTTTIAQIKGPSSSQTPYVLPVAPGVKTTSILTTGDAVGGYEMAGIPDGTGAFDNGDGTFTLVMNHELGNTAGGVRAHGVIGAFVSKWIIKKADLSVLSGSDLIRNVKLWNGSNYVTYNAANPSPPARFSRLCSADLPSISAFYNNITGKGTQTRIFMNGEETGAEGRAFGHLLTGAEAGTSYELPYLGKFSWENSVANPATGDKTVVAGTDDATPGQVYFYIGTKSTTGNDIEKAGLANGKLFGPAVQGMLVETSASVPAAETPFTMVDLGNVAGITGGTLQSNSSVAGVSQFLRPEDGAWDPLHPQDFYFVTTNSFTAPSRLWRLHFTDINDLSKGGTITALLDGTEGQKMLDNICIDNWGHVLMLEDVGGNPHNGKIWQYTIATDELKLLAMHDVARFGDIGIPATAPYNIDEETSGIIDMQQILGAGMFLLVDQAHYSLPSPLVEGGQMLAMYNPDTYNACADFKGIITVSPSPTVPGQAANTIYLGYGPQNLTLTASVAGRYGPYTYKWSNGGATSSSIIVSPSTYTTYKVTITNIFGCSNTVSVDINVLDIRDGNKNKVFICHNGHIQSVSVNAVPAHLSHGDLLGSCGENQITNKKVDAQTEKEIFSSANIYPNPAGNVTNITLNLLQEEPVNFAITDAQGRVVTKTGIKKLKAGVQQVSLNTTTLENGFYFVQISYKNQKTVLKLVIAH